MQDRRSFLTTTAAAAALFALPGVARASRRGVRDDVDMVIHKNPGCMCCNRWAEHLSAQGLTSRIEERTDLAAFKTEMEIPEDLRSCHTGVIQGYLVEGHVPGQDILALLDSKPDVLGIAVPGMPTGSPGMESGDRVDPYQVIAFGGARGRYVFAEHG